LQANEACPLVYLRGDRPSALRRPRSICRWRTRDGVETFREPLPSRTGRPHTGSMTRTSRTRSARCPDRARWPGLRPPQCQGVDKGCPAGILWIAGGRCASPSDGFDCQDLRGDPPARPPHRLALHGGRWHPVRPIRPSLSPAHQPTRRLEMLDRRAAAPSRIDRHALRLTLPPWNGGSTESRRTRAIGSAGADLPRLLDEIERVDSDFPRFCCRCNIQRGVGVLRPARGEAPKSSLPNRCPTSSSRRDGPMSTAGRPGPCSWTAPVDSIRPAQPRRGTGGRRSSTSRLRRCRACRRGAVSSASCPDVASGHFRFSDLHSRCSPGYAPTTMTCSSAWHRRTCHALLTPLV